jgi:hypothetical protein
MAATYTVDGDCVIGDRKMTYGTITDDGTGTGTFKTGLIHVEGVWLTPKAASSAVTANQCVVYETFPVCVDTITFSCDASLVLYWCAIGY